MLAIIFAKVPTLQEFCHCFLHVLPCQESPMFSPIIGFYNAEYGKYIYIYIYLSVRTGECWEQREGGERCKMSHLGCWVKNEEEGIWGIGSPIEKASPVAWVAKNPSANAGDIRDMGSKPGLGRFPGGGHGNPLQYSCLKNPHGQRSLAGPQGHKELDKTKST